MESKYFEQKQSIAEFMAHKFMTTGDVKYLKESKQIEKRFTVTETENSGENIDETSNHGN